MENEDGNLRVYGGTLNPKRQQLTDEVYWLTLGCGWDDKDNVLCLSDVLPDTPTSPFSRLENGTLQERTFNLDRDTGNVVMTVNVYRAQNCTCEETPFKIYDVVYQRIE